MIRLGRDAIEVIIIEMLYLLFSRRLFIFVNYLFIISLLSFFLSFFLFL